MKNRKVRLTIGFGCAVFILIVGSMFLRQSETVITALITLLGSIFASFVVGNSAEHVAQAIDKKSCK